MTSETETEEFNKGFATNKQRENAFYFNEEAVNRFLENNRFTHIIRSNNIYNSNGYALHFGNKCLTVFSNSNFKDDNELVTALVDSHKIRIVSIQTKKSDNNKTENSV